MSNDPRFPSLEEIMNGSPFDIIDSPWGHIERWRASTLATGTMGALDSVYQTVRSDASAQVARADEAAAQHTLIQHVLDQITQFEKRFDAHVARLAEAEDKRRADAARKAAFDEEPLTLPPGDPPASGTPPGGELHTLAPKEEPDLEVEDDASRQGSDQGDLPEELKKGVAPAPATYPNFELPKPPVVSQPVAISLNKE
jgi:hypothetical protein